MPRKVFLFLQPLYHFCFSWIAALCYGFPSRRLVVIGVTGTKGKTTVIELLHQIFQNSGQNVASLSSLRFKIRDRETRNELKMTMPGRFTIQKFLHEALRERCRYVIMEVTSEGIKQYRHRFIRFRSAVFTNVQPEHLESHGGFENYLRAKLDLFYRLSPDGVAILNADDPMVDRFGAATRAHRVWYGHEAIRMNNTMWSVREIHTTDQGIEFECDGHSIRSSLLGEFNVSNILAALAVVLAHHLSWDSIGASIEQVRDIPGRMEFVQKTPFAVVVDYAHTPDSLRAVYTFLKKFPQQGMSVLSYPRLICVLGAAGGGRDQWKRPEFGRIAQEYCSDIFLTNEDPYDENPQEIIHEIEKGFLPNSDILFSRYQKIIDRREAIHASLQSAQAGDTVVITGKGAEPWIMGPQGEKIPWDDRVAAREELEKIGLGHQITHS